MGSVDKDWSRAKVRALTLQYETEVESGDWSLQQASKASVFDDMVETLHSDTNHLLKSTCDAESSTKVPHSVDDMAYGDLAQWQICRRSTTTPKHLD
jgi:hypothetical protein